MNVYVKSVKQSEYELTLITSRNGISPRIHNVVFEDEKISIAMEKYPCTLYDIPRNQRRQYKDQIKTLIKKLHNLGILWIDIHEENIVINPDTNDVKLIIR